MNIIEYIKENLGKREKQKLLNGNMTLDDIKLLLDKVHDTIAIIDNQGNIEYVNQGNAKTFKELLYYDGNETTYKDIVRKTKENRFL